MSPRSCFTVSAPPLRCTPRECHAKGSRSSWRESMCDDQTLLCKIGCVCGIVQLQSAPSDQPVCKLKWKRRSRSPRLNKLAYDQLSLDVHFVRPGRRNLYRNTYVNQVRHCSRARLTFALQRELAASRIRPTDLACSTLRLLRYQFGSPLVEIFFATVDYFPGRLWVDMAGKSEKHLLNLCHEGTSQCPRP